MYLRFSLLTFAFILLTQTATAQYYGPIYKNPAYEQEQQRRANLAAQQREQEYFAALPYGFGQVVSSTFYQDARGYLYTLPNMQGRPIMTNLWAHCHNCQGAYPLQRVTADGQEVGDPIMISYHHDPLENLNRREGRYHLPTYKVSENENGTATLYKGPAGMLDQQQIHAMWRGHKVDLHRQEPEEESCFFCLF